MSRHTGVLAVALVACMASACGDDAPRHSDTSSVVDGSAHDVDASDDPEDDGEAPEDARARDAAAADAGRQNVAADASSAQSDARVMEASRSVDAGSQDASLRDANSSVPSPDGGTPDASEDAGDIDPLGEAGIVIPDLRPGPSGRECHEGVASGALLSFSLVTDAWAPAAGGTIAPGTYELIAEERRVGPGASESDVASCMQYDGPYRENLVVNKDQYLRVTEAVSGAFAREVFNYTAQDTVLTRSQLCPSEIDFQPAPLSFTASERELWLFDTTFPSCQYLFKYRKKL